MTDYKQGQVDLIKHIKEDVLSIVNDNVNGANIMLDVVSLLQKLEPIDKPLFCDSVK